jgi:ABC-type transport system involved in cytochrome bd biosynthesis fused ATPase/permease subunit
VLVVVICVLVFTVFCIVCTVFLVYVYVVLFVLSVLPPSVNSIAVTTTTTTNNNNNNYYYYYYDPVPVTADLTKYHYKRQVNKDISKKEKSDCLNLNPCLLAWWSELLNTSP